jgi:probable F420-dependent oxidoreductase
MNLSIFVDTYTPKMKAQNVVDMAVAAEEAGFYGVWCGDHPVFFVEYDSSHPFAERGFRQDVGVGMIGPFTTLAVLAGKTERIKLGTAVVILAEHNPVETAKAAADIDFYSGGRMRLGVGLGWSREEYAALGAPFERRGKRTDEYLEVIRRLWVEPVASFGGETYELPECFLNPKPVQQPHPPILWATGGDPMSPKALRRTVDYSAGWIGLERSPEGVAEQLEQLREPFEAAGRDLEEFEVIAGPPADRDWGVAGSQGRVKTLDRSLIERYAKAGATELVLQIGGDSGEEAVEYIRGWGAEAVAIANEVS